MTGSWQFFDMMTIMQLIDTHCHLDFEVFDDDREQVLEESRDAGLVGIIVPATHQQGWQNLLSICADHESLYPALGLHPLYLDQHREAHLVQLEQTIGQSEPVAIGEIGLDFRKPAPDTNQQLSYFEQQLSIAREKQLPVILHVLKAHEQALLLLKKNPVIGGTVHAFNGSLQQAVQYIDLGFKLGFGGMLTYEHSRKLRKLAASIPMDSIVLETDAPDMTVSQHQHQRNSPVYLQYCLHALAGLRNDEAEEVAAQTTMNAVNVFSLNKYHS